MSPLVSILIPVFNRDAIISETLQSALAQTYKNIEIIVVDNASTDKTWSVIQKFAEKDPRIKVYRNDSNIGPVRNWLCCVEQARGEYGKILWSDDLIETDFIEKTLPLFDDDVGFVYTSVNVFNARGLMNARPQYRLNGTGFYPSSLYIEKAIYNKGVPASPGCAIFRMRDINKYLWSNIPNKVNSDFSMHAIGNDLLLFLLVANDYRLFGYIDEPLSSFRSHDGSISISSESGKLPLHYALVKAYFVENYLPSAASCLAAHIQLMIWRFKGTNTFGMNSVEDFFMKPVKVHLGCLIKETNKKIMRTQKQLFTKILKTFGVNKFVKSFKSLEK